MRITLSNKAEVDQAPLMKKEKAISPSYKPTQGRTFCNNVNWT